ncbi:MAG: hypothetical protein QXW37_06085 [Candidatus Nitrosotenuis sp.]
MSSVSMQWYDEFLGVAYRYFDLRMNVIPLFSTKKEASDLWNETVHWWSDHDIKLRFVEAGNQYWFILASESRRPDHNMSIYKLLPKSENYLRFKKGHQGEAYLRFAVFTKKNENEVKDDAVCNCGHKKEDHNGLCNKEDCKCQKFETFVLNMLRKKKTITNIKFLEESDVKDDSISWNCLYVNKYKNFQ